MKIFGKLFFFYFFEGAKCFLSLLEIDILLSLTKTSYIKECFIVPKEIAEVSAVNLSKILSENKLFTVFIQGENLKKYLEKMDMKVYKWTAIVLKEESLNSLDYFNNKTIISSYFWFLFDASNGTLRRELLSVEIPHDSALFLVEKITPVFYTISEYYKIKKEVPGVIQLISEWKNNRLISTINKHWYDRKSNMHQYKFVTVKFNESLYLSPKEKVNEVIWEELSELLNFSIKQRLIPFHPGFGFERFGSEDEEALLDTEIYFGNEEKSRHLLGPTTQSRLFMHVKAVGEYKGLSRFLKPFSQKTWLCTFYWLCCCGFFCFLIEYISRIFGYSAKPWKESFLNVLTPLDCLCNQSVTETSHNFSSRLVLFVIRLSAGVMSYAYAATFLSYLLLYMPELPFTNLKGFVKDGTYKIIAERNSDVDTYFRVSSQPLDKLVFTKYLSDVTKWSRLDKEVDRICNGEKLVLIAYDDDIEKYKPCDIIKLRKPLKILTNGFKIRFRSPFRGLLHIKLLLLKTTGVLARVNGQILHQNIKKFRKKTSYKINMEKVSFIFNILFYGTILSVVILVLEMIIAQLIRSKRRKQIKPTRRWAAQRTKKKI